MPATLHRDCTHNFVSMSINFERFNSGLQRYGSVVKTLQDLHDAIRTRRSPLDDLDAKIVARLNKSPFEPADSIAETLRVAHSIVLLDL
jgi:hypothetical protein